MSLSGKASTSKKAKCVSNIGKGIILKILRTHRQLNQLSGMIRPAIEFQILDRIRHAACFSTRLCLMHLKFVSTFPQVHVGGCRKVARLNPKLMSGLEQSQKKRLHILQSASSNVESTQRRVVRERLNGHLAKIGRTGQRQILQRNYLHLPHLPS